ncbi:hypothetical protein LPJ75_002932, partial [Coemansia sp. RSA 2598]
PPPIPAILENLEQLQQDILQRQPEKSQQDLIEPLGLRDRKVVAQALDILVVFGIQPQMHQGVGIPLSLRVRSDAAAIMAGMLQRQSKLLVDHWKATTDTEQLGTVGLAQMARRLVGIVDNKISWGTADVAHILLTKYTPDMFALLMQAAYAPLPPENIKPPPGYLEAIETDRGRRVALQRAYTRIYQETNVYLLLETLTSLLNTAVTCKPQPRWFCTLCSRFLTRIMLRPRGVQVAVDFFMGNDAEVTAEKLDRIASLVLTAPGAMDGEEYLAGVVPQLIEAIAETRVPGDTGKTADSSDDFVAKMVASQAVRERVHQASVYIVRRMSDKTPALFRRLVAQPTNAPLLRWFATRESQEPRDKPGQPDANASVAIGGDAVLSGGLQKRRLQTRPLIQVIEESPRHPQQSDTSAAAVVSSAEELARTLAIHSALVLDGVCSPKFLADLVLPVFAPLLHWYAGERDPEAKHRLLGVLVAALRQLPPQASVSTVLGAIQLVRGDASAGIAADWPVFRQTAGAAAAKGTQLLWHTGVAGTGVAGTAAAAEDGGPDQQEAVVPADALMEVCASDELREFRGDLFVSLLREQQAALELLDSQAGRPAYDGGMLRKWWLVSQTTLSMVDRFGPSVLARHQDILAFIFDTLDRYSATLGAKASEQAAPNAAQDPPSLEALIATLDLGKRAGVQADGQQQDDLDDVEDRVGGAELAVLALMLLGQVMTVSEHQAFRQLAPGLAQQLDPEAPADTLPTVSWDAASLRHLRGILAQLERLQATEPVPAVGQVVAQVKTQVSMILALNGANDPADRSTPTPTAAEQESGGDVRRFNAALRDVRSDLVPVQAHGVLELRNLVLSKTPILTRDRVEATVGVFLETLRSDDTYLYLNAIRGLSALADTGGQLFIPRLVELYKNAASLDEFLRIGEALLQTVHRAGRMLGHYAETIVPVLVGVLRSEEEMRRHSALSVLSMAAEVDALGLHRWVDLITATLDDLMAVERGATMLRRAAVMFWLSLVRGYGDRVRALIDRDSLLTMYR